MTENKMSPKEYLSQAMYIDQRIDSKLQQVATLRESAAKVTATLTDMPRSASPNPQAMENTIVKIIDLGMKDIEHRLEERNIKLSLTEAAKKFIADESYDPAYGARPVKRFLQRSVETELAGEIIRGTVKDGDSVIIDSDGSKLSFQTR